jgi:hypothetical protein
MDLSLSYHIVLVEGVDVEKSIRLAKSIIVE